MTPTLVRLAILTLVGGGAWLLVGWWQRKPGKDQLPLPTGITLVTGPGCSLCGPVERALVRAGAPPMVTDIGALELVGPPIRSLPVALVVDESGTVIMRRSGRAALEDAVTLAERASSL